ncbi:MAG: FIST C-terminal domain-containing protein [Burkholderiaceae bacterium]|nr:FIST C-terminal domain-containing protein [Burkholderiaceae bacterium]
MTLSTRTFRHGHAAQGEWHELTQRVIAQLSAREPPGDSALVAGLGLLYVTEGLSDRLPSIASTLGERFPGVRWVGAAAHGVCVGGAEYAQEPALVAMICELPADSWRVFSGSQRLPAIDSERSVVGPRTSSALVHADSASAALPESIAGLAHRLDSGFLFGGLVGGAESRGPQLAGGVVHGGLSGVAFGAQVHLLSRVTQGCAPLSREHIVSACTSHYIERLDERPALDVLLDDLDVRGAARDSHDGEEILRALPAERLSRGLMIGFAPPEVARGVGFGDYVVRNVLGIDPQNRVIAVSTVPRQGDRAVFCTRDQQAARADLVRVCTELREELESGELNALGAHYVSCVARGEHLFGATGVELGIIAHNLGEIPLVGFFANGEIAYDRIYGYTGVLTLFVEQRNAARI